MIAPIEHRYLNALKTMFILLLGISAMSLLCKSEEIVTPPDIQIIGLPSAPSSSQGSETSGVVTTTLERTAVIEFNGMRVIGKIEKRTEEGKEHLVAAGDIGIALPSSEKGGVLTITFTHTFEAPVKIAIRAFPAEHEPSVIELKDKTIEIQVVSEKKYVFIGQSYDKDIFLDIASLSFKPGADLTQQNFSSGAQVKLQYSKQINVDKLSSLLNESMEMIPPVLTEW